MDQTNKKLPKYINQKPKKFLRRSFGNSQRSIDSKQSSNQQNSYLRYIRTPKAQNKTVGINSTSFQKYFSLSLLPYQIPKQATKNPQHYNTQKFYNQKNDKYHFQIDSLKLQLSLKTQEYQMLVKSLQKTKQQLHFEKQKRRNIQLEKKDLSKQLVKESKKRQQLQSLNTKLYNQIENLVNKVSELQNGKYKTLQSQRQKYLQSQINKLRDKIKLSKTIKQIKLEQQIQKINQEKYVLEAHYKALKLANQCLLKQLTQFQTESQDYPILVQQHQKLKQKYKKFLNDYKQLRAQFWALKTQVNSDNHDSSLLSITISQNE